MHFNNARLKFRVVKIGEICPSDSLLAEPGIKQGSTFTLLPLTLIVHHLLWVCFDHSFLLNLPHLTYNPIQSWILDSTL